MTIARHGQPGERETLEGKLLLCQVLVGQGAQRAYQVVYELHSRKQRGQGICRYRSIRLGRRGQELREN